MDNINEKTCAFAGNRPEDLDYDEVKVKAWLEEKIREAINEGYSDFITGMQRGVDLWAAEIVIKLKKEGNDIRLFAACAFRGMENAWVNAPRISYYYVLSEADEVVIVSQKPGRKAFLQRNCYMVDHASRLIAVYSGMGKGTYNIINYAKERGLEIVAFDQDICNSPDVKE